MSFFPFPQLKNIDLHMKRGSSRGSLRATVITNAITSLLNSNAMLCLISTCLLLVLVVLFKYPWYLFLLPAIFIFVKWKELAFELFLIWHMLESEVGTYKWYTQIDQGLYLGGLPIKELGHQQLLAKLKVQAVLSIVEPFELTCKTLIGSPVDFNSMQNEESFVHHTVLQAPDFVPPPVGVLDEGADFINKHLGSGRNVYCHCKSGVGRSASVVGAYFIKYKRMSTVEAWGEMKILRGTVFGDKSPQFKNLQVYERMLKEGHKFR